jgi:hypothetical protein
MVERFSLANDGGLTGKSSGKLLKAPVRIKVIHDEDSSRSQGCPGLIQFKSDDAFAMHAVRTKSIHP